MLYDLLISKLSVRFFVAFIDIVGYHREWYKDTSFAASMAAFTVRVSMYSSIHFRMVIQD